MIDVETINEKCLIALQALQDIMNDFEYDLPQEFKKYLQDLEVWETNWKVDSLFRELKNLPIRGKIENIFVSNDEDVGSKSLWFFLEGYSIEVKNVGSGEPLHDIQMTALQGNAAWVNIKKQNFDLGKADSISNTPRSKLQISVKLDQVLSLPAAGKANCQHLLRIYRKYLEPLFPI